MFIVAKECNDLIWFQEAVRTFVPVPSTVVWSATTAPFPSAQLGQERFQPQRQALQDLPLILPRQTANAQILKEMRIEGCCQVLTLLFIPHFLPTSIPAIFSFSDHFVIPWLNLILRTLLKAALFIPNASKIWLLPHPHISTCLSSAKLFFETGLCDTRSGH